MKLVIVLGDVDCKHEPRIEGCYRRRCSIWRWCLEKMGEELKLGRVLVALRGTTWFMY